MLAVFPIRCAPGTPLRIDFSIPSHSRPIPIPSVVVRETTVNNRYAVGIKFRPMPACLAVLRAFVQGEIRQSIAESPVLEGRAPGQEVPPGSLRTEPEPQAPDRDVVELVFERPEERTVGSSPAARTHSPASRRMVRKSVARRLMTVARKRGELAVKDEQKPVRSALPASLSDKPDDVPEYYDRREVYDERELRKQQLPQDARLMGLYRAAVAELEAPFKKKRKGWFS
jgi:hypothetical protein